MEFGKTMNLDKFDGSNFKQWKFQIKCALRAKGLDINQPIPETNTCEWNKNDGMAMFIITSAMDLKQVALIENCETALEVMTKLESIYEQKSEMNKMILHERFYQYKMSPGDSMAQHIAKIESMAKQLKENGEDISDTAIITKILSTLPLKYRSLRQAWMSLDASKQTVINLTARLLDEEASFGVEEENETALVVAKQNEKKRNFKTTEAKKEFKETVNHRFVCYKCGRRGHYAKDCRATKQNQEEKNMLAFNIDSHEWHDDHEETSWILDSGASAHMSYKRENFVELYEYKGPTLKLGNQEDIEVLGQGNVLINKCVNGQWEKSILKNVLYVPKLRRNLFSEGVVSRQGYSIMKKHTEALIYKDNDIVMCAFLQSNNLYKLKVKTVQNPVCNVVQKLDLKTWHERLGHLNVKEIQKMCKNNVITGVDLSDCEKFVCEGCAYGKHARRPFQKSSRQSPQPGDIVYSDVCGPINVPSVQAWNDGNIRAFTPLTGRLIYVIFNTHNKGTSALDMTSDGRTLISGGCEGQVRVWDIKPEHQTLKKVLKEHKSPVSAIQVSPNNTEAVSAGTDGSCIIWDLISLSRRQVMYANTLFMCVCFEPQGCQLLTGGSDRRVAYWETGSGNLARELEASKVGAVNGLHITQNGELFVTGGNDQMVKLWKYQEGIYTHMGLGHAGAVTCCRFSPDARFIVSSCAAGSIIVWRVPEQYIHCAAPPQPSAKKPAASPKTLQDELRLPLGEARAHRAAGDRPYVPAAPNKTEKIEAMDTTRGSVVCCPCDDTARSANSKKSSEKPSPKPTPNPTGKKCCRPPDNLPTRTTSKEYVSGSGDKK